VNRLVASKSPYLQQHASNPVDWYPWGSEALERARREDKLILLSVGYSACHWCHVMAHESFEDPDIARLMNERYVNVKVDREERPDIDAIYQKVLQIIERSGGWPMTAFLLPDQRPLFVGTYFPPVPMGGRPSFRQLVTHVAEAWAERREEMLERAEYFTEALAEVAERVGEVSAGVPLAALLAGDAPLAEATRRLVARADKIWGGFGMQPKFPNPSCADVVMLQTRRDGAGSAELLLTLERMWRGGIYDHLRGGFARYATDREWLVPHFEKMLYDNAQLIGVFADASLLWPRLSFMRRAVRETIAYLEEEMRGPHGTFYAATDADSEGVEGKYFCWNFGQLVEALGRSDAELFAHIYGVSLTGHNFVPGMSVLSLVKASLGERAAELGCTEEELERRLAPMRARLLAVRSRRVAPQRDEKVITAWNALLVSGLVRAAYAADAWGEDALARRWLDLARAAGERLASSHIAPSGEVLRIDFHREVHVRGYLEDVAFLARACLDLHEATLEASWQEVGQRLARHALAHYATSGGDGFYVTADDAERLLERGESQHDSAMPSGLGVIVEVLLRLDLAGCAPAGARAAAEACMLRYRGAAAEPFPYASLIAGAQFADLRAAHVTLRGPDPAAVAELARVVRRARPRAPGRLGVSFEGHPEVSALVCRAQVCNPPLTEAEALEVALIGEGSG